MNECFKKIIEFEKKNLLFSTTRQKSINFEAYITVINFSTVYENLVQDSNLPMQL